MKERLHPKFFDDAFDLTKMVSKVDTSAGYYFAVLLGEIGDVYKSDVPVVAAVLMELAEAMLKNVPNGRMETELIRDILSGRIKATGEVRLNELAGV